MIRSSLAPPPGRFRSAAIWSGSVIARVDVAHPDRRVEGALISGARAAWIRSITKSVRGTRMASSTRRHSSVEGVPSMNRTQTAVAM